MNIEDVKVKLRGCDFFRQAPPGFINDLAAVVEVTQVAEGAQIFSKDDPGNCMYMIGEGVVQVHDGETVMRELAAGDVFGELGALVGEVRTASVRAISSCVLYGLNQSSLYKTLDAHSGAYRSVISGMCHRGRDLAEDARDRLIKVQVFQHELDIGRKIQAGFLPDDLPQLDGWDIACHFQSAREVAGDFYDVFRLESVDHVALIIGDVCGKGVGAALFMTLFRSLLRATLLSSIEGCSGDTTATAAQADTNPQRVEPEHMLAHAITVTNAYIATTHGKSSMFASVFAAVLDPASGSMWYINGGHEAPFVVTGTKHRRLDITGPALGLFPDARYEVKSEQLQPGDLWFAYTDGVPEAMDPSKNQFDEQRVLKVLRETNLDSTATINRVLSDLSEFINGAEQHDDITILALRRND